jgi:hypothetical protein
LVVHYVLPDFLAVVVAMHHNHAQKVNTRILMAIPIVLHARVDTIHCRQGSPPAQLPLQDIMFSMQLVPHPYANLGHIRLVARHLALTVQLVDSPHHLDHHLVPSVMLVTIVRPNHLVRSNALVDRIQQQVQPTAPTAKQAITVLL